MLGVPPLSFKKKSIKNWPKNSVFWAKNAVFGEKKFVFGGVPPFSVAVLYFFVSGMGNTETQKYKYE